MIHVQFFSSISLGVLEYPAGCYRVNFDTPLVNTHDAFNSSDSVFTAPASGAYCFFSSFQVLTTCKDVIVIFIIRNTLGEMLTHEFSKNNNKRFQASLAIKLGKGCTVEVMIQTPKKIKISGLEDLPPEEIKTPPLFGCMLIDETYEDEDLIGEDNG